MATQAHLHNLFGGNAACVIQTTLPALLSDIANNLLTPGCIYVVQGVTQGNLGTFDVAVLALDTNQVSMDAHVLTTWDPSQWWDGMFDINLGQLVEVRDNAGNRVVGDQTIATFPWGAGWANVEAVHSSFFVGPGFTVTGSQFFQSIVFDVGGTSTNVTAFGLRLDRSGLSVDRSPVGSLDLSDIVLETSFISFNDTVDLSLRRVLALESFIFTTTVTGGAVIGVDLSFSTMLMFNVTNPAFYGISARSSLFFESSVPSATTVIQNLDMANSGLFVSPNTFMSLSNVRLGNSSFGAFSAFQVSMNDCDIDSSLIGYLNQTTLIADNSSFHGSSVTATFSAPTTMSLTSINNSSIYFRGATFNSFQAEITSSNLTLENPGFTVSRSSIISSNLEIYLNVSSFQAIDTTIISSTFVDRGSGSRFFSDTTASTLFMDVSPTSNISFISDLSTLSGWFQAVSAAGTFYISRSSMRHNVRLNIVQIDTISVYYCSIDGFLLVDNVSNAGLFTLQFSHIGSWALLRYIFSNSPLVFIAYSDVSAGGDLAINGATSNTSILRFDVGQGTVTVSGGSSERVFKRRGGQLNLGAFGHGDVSHNVGFPNTLTASNFNRSRDDFNNNLI